jgi:hypothetical protein
MATWITTEEAVEISGYHVVHIRRLITGGQIAAVKKGHAWWVDRKSLERFMRDSAKSNDARRGGRSAKTRAK